MLGRNTALSGALMVLARLISRVVDLLTMLILARLLSPVDFGLVTVAMTIILIFEAALEMPLSQALVRLPEIKNSYYDTAFTLGVLRGLLLCGGISLLAMPFANFYKHPELVPLIDFLSLAPAARGLINPRLAHFAKNLNFKYEFAFELVGKISAFGAGIITAFLTHSYWSIAVCTVVTPLVIAIISYTVLPFRPRLTLSDWRIFADFLGWISISQVVLAINWQSDQLLLGKLMRPTELGLFSLANNVTNIPMAALFSPLMRPLLSAFTMVREDRKRLQSSFQSAASAVVTIGLPLLIGQSLVAGPMVRLLLGEKWLGAIPLISLLAISLVPMLFGILLTTLSMALGETKTIVTRNIVQLAVKLPLVVFGALKYGFAGIIAARILSETITAVYCMVVIRRLCGISVARQFFSCWRAIVSVSFMTVVTSVSMPYFEWGSDLFWVAVQLAATVTVGAASYSICLFLLWRFEGRPGGFEALVLRSAMSLLPGKRRRNGIVIPPA